MFYCKHSELTVSVLKSSKSSENLNSSKLFPLVLAARNGRQSPKPDRVLQELVHEGQLVRLFYGMPHLFRDVVTENQSLSLRI